VLPLLPGGITGTFESFDISPDGHRVTVSDIDSEQTLLEVEGLSLE